MTDIKNDRNKCFFCKFLDGKIPNEKAFVDGKNFFAILDGYPVTELHTLIVPKKHISDRFDLTKDEVSEMEDIMQDVRKKILEMDKTVTGFNIGNNVGEDAGQTVWHVHTHVIPRRKGDVENPRGGVRGVIPDKRMY